MEVKKVVDYIENSFVSELLLDKNITDISFNGKHIFYQHNYLGRQKYEGKVTNEMVQNFLRQLANLSEKQFSFQNPILDISIDRYRLNAVHHSVARLSNNQVYTFDLRIAKPEIIDLKQAGFLNENAYNLLKVILENRQSIVIGGHTSSGKTELQKYLIKEMEDNTRVIVIDNVLELDQIQKSNENIDLNNWLVFETREELSVQNLVKNALRNNPDWLIVAESRGKEMLDVLDSAMTGHPIITTIHAQDSGSMIERIVEMVMMNEKKLQPSQIRRNVLSHVHFFVYLTIEEDKNGSLVRYISSITYGDGNGIYEIYHTNLKEEKYAKLPQRGKELLKSNRYSLDISKFLEVKR